MLQKVVEYAMIYDGNKRYISTLYTEELHRVGNMIIAGVSWMFIKKKIQFNFTICPPNGNTC